MGHWQLVLVFDVVAFEGNVSYSHSFHQARLPAHLFDTKCHFCPGQYSLLNYIYSLQKNRNSIDFPINKSTFLPLQLLFALSKVNTSSDHTKSLGYNLRGVFHARGCDKLIPTLHNVHV